MFYWYIIIEHFKQDMIILLMSFLSVLSFLRVLISLIKKLKCQFGITNSKCSQNVLTCSFLIEYLERYKKKKRYKIDNFVRV